MSEVLHGNASGDQLNVSSDKTQAYGLSGNDTLTSDGKSNVLLVGGSGNDSLIMKGGNGTLSGGAGNDIFELNYSATEKISAVIEDLEPSKDKIVVNFDGNVAPQLSSKISGNDVIWTDGGNFNLTVKSVRENDYFDGDASDEAWEVLKLTNDMREAQNLLLLTASEGLTEGATIRAQEITGLGQNGALTNHIRPNGEHYSTVLKNKYKFLGENLDGGASSPVDVVIEDWMNSESHRENILNEKFKKLGVGYNYYDEDKSNLRYYWVQLFADALSSPETVSTKNLLSAIPEVNTIPSLFVSLSENPDIYSNSAFGATIEALSSNDLITNNNLNVSISGGADNDTVDNHASFATVKAGKGDDSINLGSTTKEILVQYTLGDGSDTVSGLNQTDTVSISGDEYTPLIVGNDIVVTVATDAITLSEAAKNGVQVIGTRSKLVILSEGNDNYKSTLDNATVMALGGNDTIRNGLIWNDSTKTYEAAPANNVLLLGGAGDDSINNYGASVTIEGGDDNDYVWNYGVILNKETDTYENSNSNVSINGGNGNDYILNWSGAIGVTIEGGTGDDTVYNTSSNVTINGGANNDSISTFGGSQVSIVGGDNDDTITNAIGEQNTMDGGDGNDSIYNALFNDFASINGGTGNDSIHNGGESVTIDAGAGDDYIENQKFWVRGGHSSIINAGDGNDSIDNNSNNVTINGGRGNDLIIEMDLEEFSLNNLILYNLGDGRDTIVRFDSNDTLRIGDGSDTYSSLKSSDDIIIQVGTGLIKLSNAAGLSVVHIEGKLTKPSEEDNFIALSENPDTYSNTVEGATIQAKGGEDSITNEYANVSISGGADNDTIENSGSQVIISGGLGNDSITLANNAQDNLIQYASGDGSDTVSGFKVTDLISITGGEYTRSTVENDVIIKVDDDSITLLDAATLSAINIDGKLNRPIIIDGKSITLTEYDDEYDNTIEGATIAALAGNDSIKNYNRLEGNVLNVSINGGAGDDTIGNTAASVTIEGSAGNDSIYNGSDLVTIDGGTNNDSIKNTGSFVTMEGGDGNDYIENAIREQVTISGGTGNDTISNSGSFVTMEGGDGDDYIENAINENVTISGGTGNDFIQNGSDSGITINGGADNDSVSNTGDNATILGGDGDDSISNELGTNVTIDGGSGNDSIFNDYALQVIINGADDNDYIYNDCSNNVTISGGTGNDSIINRFSDNVSISGGTGSDSIKNGGSTIESGVDSLNSNVTLEGGDGDDTIETYYSKNTTIVGGAGNDQISLSTKSQNNLIIYNPGDGNDTIWGLKEGDTLQIGDGTGRYSTQTSGNDVSENDVIVKVGNGTITLKDFRDKPEHVIIGESGSSGGGSGGSGGGSSGGGGGGGSSGGTSGSAGSNSAASASNSASGNSGTSSSNGGSSGRGNNTVVTRQTVVNFEQPPSPNGNQIISNYQSGEKLHFNADYSGALFDSKNNFFAGFSTGAIIVPNAMDKVIDIRDNSDNQLIKAYAASKPGVIDGRRLGGFEIIKGSAGADEIYSGRGGAQMIGGAGNDTLTGWKGVDIFITGKTQGSDLIRNSSVLDKVNLTDINWSDVVSTSENGNSVILRFNSGNSITVESSEALSSTFMFADGSARCYNYSTKSWQTMKESPVNGTPKIYEGGSQSISSYKSGERIIFNADYKGGSYDGAGNFSVNSSKGMLVVQNAMDKVIDLRNGANNPIIKAYAASKPGTIDGRNIAGFELINGSSGADVICAGDGGSQLWGGAGDTADVLIGGDGADVFIGGRTQGADLIQNASSADTVNFNDATLADIVATSENNGAISLAFNTGNVINVQSSETMSAKFTLADDSSYRYNHSRKTWQSA